MNRHIGKLTITVVSINDDDDNNNNKECIYKEHYSQKTCSNALFTKVFTQAQVHIISTQNKYTK